MMNPFKGMTKEELLSEAQRYKHLCECFQKIDKTKSKKIRDLEAQLAARNQAAEAMGVLERLVPREPKQLVMSLKGDEYVIWDADNFGALCDVGAAEPSLIEAVLKAGGEDA